LPGVEKAILSDTVGFVSELPTQLVAAFHATLEEVIDADIIVHVRDIAHPDTEAQREDVVRVMAEIGAGGEEGAPVIEAWNKIDLLDPETRAVREAEATRRDDVVLISALSGEGVDALARRLSDRLTSSHRIRRIELNVADGAAAAWLYANGTVEEEVLNGERMSIKVRLSDVDFARFQARSFS
jgi:GTP-binding protein HflX